jgi:hypothetical protein
MLALLPALAPRIAIAQQRKPAAGSAFSFAAYGDSRSMMYLPYKSDQREEAIKLMIEIFAPPAVAAQGAGKLRDVSALAGA